MALQWRTCYTSSSITVVTSNFSGFIESKWNKFFIAWFGDCSIYLCNKWAKLFFKEKGFENWTLVEWWPTLSRRAYGYFITFFYFLTFASGQNDQKHVTCRQFIWLPGLVSSWKLGQSWSITSNAFLKFNLTVHSTNKLNKPIKHIKRNEGEQDAVDLRKFIEGSPSTNRLK